MMQEYILNFKVFLILRKVIFIIFDEPNDSLLN